MHYVADRSGKVWRENSLQDKVLEGFYGHMLGRTLLKPLTLPVVSKAGGALLDCGISRIMIRPFIRRNGIAMEEYETKRYRSYNDFFTRKLRQGMRRVAENPKILPAPCDGRLCVYKIDDRNVFTVKHTKYTVGSLLRNRKLADSYAGGYVWVFRLCVEDYHRYIYVDDGYVSGSVKLTGVLHTVNPVANDYYPIYKENGREYCLLYSKQFGTVLMMEVGALFVGMIENRPGRRKVKRGEEKGNFAFGGSTVILMTKKGSVCPDRDILRNSVRGIETMVRMGEGVGKKGNNGILV
ncbi:phosphatidylserine decarboxylase proenzyme [Lachnospiraceae bacterium]|nr:phosphatidylserine decarboxylase [Eubacterium sp.]GFI27814.1 phosphatidylserine decarboxylase proenzyme [Lachnospiraceae bacterium]